MKTLKLNMKRSSLLLLMCLVLYSFNTFSATRQMEYLDRGVVAVMVNNGIFVSWRYLGTDDPNIGFNLYRNKTKVNTSVITASTNYTDTEGNANSSYTVRTVKNGIESSDSKVAKVQAQQFVTLTLDRPTEGTYSPGDMSVGDVDGDGQYELFVKWDPSNAKDNSQSGMTSKVYIDCYRLDGTKLWRVDLGVNIRAGAHYTQFQVYDFDGDGKAEMACKTAPGTKDGKGRNVIMGTDDPTKDYRNGSGYVLSGPEYLTMFDGLTGAEVSTIQYKPQRGNVSSWGDNYGNRVDRFLACTAYLDGVHPSLVMCRGYYTRSTLWAVDFKNGKLVERWFHDSPANGKGAYGEGFHNLSVADVDGDGKDEIIYGSACIDNDGSLYYRKGYGHGDAHHVSDMDPDNNDLEGWFVHEDGGSAYGYELRNLRTGTVIFGKKTGTDNGRGLAADIDAKHRGFEMWSSADGNVYNCKGTAISNKKPSVNFRIYWDGDLQDELLDGNKVDKWNGNGTTRLVTFTGNSCNGTKSTPNLSADIFGDWREEVILHNGSDKIYIYTTTIPTEHRLFTPMHDPVYRLGIARENTCYNQPPHLGFYIGDGLKDVKQPDIYVAGGEIVQKPILTVSSETQTLFAGNEIHAIDVTFGGSATGVEVFGLLDGLIKTGTDNGITISGVPTESGTITFKTVGGDGEQTTKSVVINVITTNLKRVAYVTDPLSANYANDTKILTALKNCQDFYVVEIDANQNIDLSPYDLIVLSEVAGSGTPLVAQMEGFDKPMLSMKVHAYKADVWNWATNDYGDNTEATTIVVEERMLNHPMFKNITFGNGNEIQMLTTVNTKGLTYMNPESFTEATGNIEKIASVKGEAQVSILEAQAGSTIAGTTLTKDYIQIGLNSSSYANVTNDGVSVVLNACYYLLGMTSGDPSDDITINVDKGLSVFPNPATNKLNIVIPTKNKKRLQLSLYRMDGIAILCENRTIENDRTVVIDRGAIPAGQYILEITSSTDKDLHFHEIILLK